jgi:hypothetical protein
VTATLDRVAARKKDKPEPGAEELVRRAREQGLSLTGPDGLLKQLTKTVLETALHQEMTEHLGHEKHGPVISETGPPAPARGPPSSSNPTPTRPALPTRANTRIVSHRHHRWQPAQTAQPRRSWINMHTSGKSGFPCLQGR